jgi:heme/copper-type cytochrome/quinol oxidase subunit 2
MTTRDFLILIVVVAISIVGLEALGLTLPVAAITVLIVGCLLAYLFRGKLSSPKSRDTEKGYTVIEVLIVSTFFVVLVVFCFIPYVFFRTDEAGATRALEAQGLTHVHVTGYRFYGCGDDYHYHTGFEALGSNGKPVTGVVCKGYTKWFGKPSSVKID